MKWILVYILIVGNDIHAVNAMGPGFKFDTMPECFAQREILDTTLKGEEGHFPVGRQAICVKTD